MEYKIIETYEEFDGNPVPFTDSLGLHRVENPSYSDTAVSLHLYCPPFEECSVFNQRTGHRSKAKVTFWSKFGNKPVRLVFITTTHIMANLLAFGQHYFTTMDVPKL